MTSMNWRLSGACASVDPDVMYPEPYTPSREVVRVKEICAGCPVQRQCLDFAMTNGEEHGIWGGLSYRERLIAGMVRKPTPTTDWVEELRKEEARRLAELDAEQCEIGWREHVRRGDLGECPPCLASKRSWVSAKQGRYRERRREAGREARRAAYFAQGA